MESSGSFNPGDACNTLHSDDRTRITAKLAELEERAGISAKMERAREGPLIPYGVFEEKPTTAEERCREHETYDDDTVAIPARAANAGLGWSLHLGRLNPPQLDFSSSPGPDFNHNIYLAADGSMHTFYPILHEGETATTGIEYTRDGSY